LLAGRPVGPPLELVPCGSGHKPALLVKVGSAEWYPWTHAV
jgi:hypothetical protein